MTKPIWTGFVCGDCGRGFRWSHRCKATGARFTTYGRVGEDVEPFGLNGKGPTAFRLPNSRYVES